MLKCNIWVQCWHKCSVYFFQLVLGGVFIEIIQYSLPFFLCDFSAENLSVRSEFTSDSQRWNNGWFARTGPSIPGPINSIIFFSLFLSLKKFWKKLKKILKKIEKNWNFGEGEKNFFEKTKLKLKFLPKIWKFVRIWNIL